ncbi:hypothetical protein EYZ11_009841 [Aspergillus tanneri]|uniref:Uncharacterized protein n=1 Tax=Aspergillus tanneri TaxID=1220188 RepID=A0A4V3UND1_9EURO|nr:uncharacterized protein ATNIH1004_005062 [Aspergillus tanneri]KAA8649167.1 hypothetical protein ATNIH1004_005062 [Aspergillus tanneri]THC90704.1 hypothetical protein EYZ11_009841 [Aspergillus tanneri]
MGIPMFREPTSIEAAKNNPIKDPCAAARSAIRRQATIRRPSRYSSSSALRSATLRPPFPRPLADEIEREANGLQRHVRSPIPNTGSGEDPFDLTSSLADTSAREAGQRLLNDVLRHSRPGQRLRIPRNTTVPDLHRRSSPGDDGTNRQDQEPPSFAPRFTPAGAQHWTVPPRVYQDVIRLSPFPRPDSLGGEVGSNVPLLRRVGQRSINEASRANRESVVDGLGDRQRSVSPDDHANDAWETLLTTITPDTNLPSANSSFTSASASGTDASMNGTSRSSATSFGTHPSSLDSTSATVQMVLEPYPEFLNPCDYPSSTDSELDSDEEASQNSLFRNYRRRVRQMDMLRRSQNTQSTTSSHPPIPTISLSFPDTSADPDLHQMQAILDRLARREDIPDDWWAAAGLARTIGHRVGANDETSNTDSVDGPSR